MSTVMRDGFVPEQTRNATTTTPTTLAAWSYEVLRPLLTSHEESPIAASGASPGDG